MNCLSKTLFVYAELNFGAKSTPSALCTTTQLIERNKWDLKNLLHFVSPIPFQSFKGHRVSKNFLQGS